MPKQWQWIVTQIGSREHYGVPRGFERIGQLKLLYTDVWRRGLMGLMRHGNATMRAFAGRYHPDIPPSKVVSFNSRAIVHAVAARRQRSVDETYHQYLRVGDEFDRSVVRDLKRRRDIDTVRDAFFGYNTGSLHSIRFCRELGLPTVLNQIDPAKTEEDIVAAEAEKWPGWEKIPGRIPQAYWNHMKSEWTAADLVLVNSEWSRQALIQQGVAAEKLRVVPLTFESERKIEPAAPSPKAGPLTVLWLGTVCLRKGIQYLIEAAKILGPGDFKFIVAGHSLISAEAIASAPPSMSFIGRVTRDNTSQYYRQADIFVLPTISDGFAITQVEAMAHGLPVITTPNCGQVVTDGMNGLIVPAGDARALAGALETLNGNRRLLVEMSHQALKRSADFAIPSQVLSVEKAINEIK